jgi:hypothetical protein
VVGRERPVVLPALHDPEEIESFVSTPGLRPAERVRVGQSS